MKKIAVFHGLAYQNGGDLPTVTEVGCSGFTFTVEQDKDENDIPIVGRFFFVKRGFFALGKCTLIFQKVDNNINFPYEIIVDHNASEPDKILITTLYNGVPSNEIFRHTPFQLVVELD